MEFLPNPIEKNLHHLERYKRFIESRPKRTIKRETDFNIHHVWPRALGGPDEDWNLIKLTHREHYIAHMILWKCYGQQMVFAFNMLSNFYGTDRLTSREFSRLKTEVYEMFHDLYSGKKIAPFSEEHKQAISVALTGRTLSEGHCNNISKAVSDRGSHFGENNPMYGRKQTEESKEKNRQSHLLLYENGYVHPMTGKTQKDSTCINISKSKSNKVQCIETGEVFESVAWVCTYIYLEPLKFRRHIYDAIKNKMPLGNFTWILIEKKYKNPSRPRSDETRHKLSMIGKTKTREKNSRSKPVMCIETNEMFSCKNEAAEKVWGSESFAQRIKRSIATNKQVNGLSWRYISKEQLLYNSLE